MFLRNKPYQDYIALVVNQHLPYLSSTPRYARFMVDESLQDWIKILGPDVCLLTHADVTADITTTYLDYSLQHDVKLSKDETVHLTLAPWIHDWGEIMLTDQGIGDITFEKKTGDHEKIEIQIFHAVTESIPDQIVRDYFRETYQKVVIKNDSFLWKLFNAVERIGYMQTALTAFKGKNGKKIKNWKGLSGNVLSNQIEKLLLYSQNDPYVSYFLKINEETINTIFKELISVKIEKDNTKSPSYDKEKFNNAFKTWKKRT